MQLALAMALFLSGGMAQAEGLTIRVDFDDRAMLTLAQIGERVVVSAFYYGDPSAKGAAQAEKPMKRAGLAKVVSMSGVRYQVSGSKS